MSYDDNLTMKPMLGKVVMEAVKLGMIDVAEVESGPDACTWGGPHDGHRCTRYPTDAERDAWRRDIYAMPAGALATIDPMALAQCVAVRLLGPGGWTIAVDGRSMYGGNASIAEVVAMTFPPPAGSETFVEDALRRAGFEVTTDVDEIRRAVGHTGDDEGQ